MLLADDGNYSMMQYTYMKLPFACTRSFSKNGFDAVEKVKEFAKQGYIFHLILMDIDMPVLNGLEASKQIREFETANNLPKTYIIGLQQQIDTIKSDKFADYGINRMIEKPISPTVVAEVIAQIQEEQIAKEK